MNKYKSAAIDILGENPSGLTTNEITAKALEKGILETDGKTPEKSMSSAIAVDIKLNGKKSSFKRIDKGIFTINETITLLPNARKEEPSDDEIETEEKLESGYTGKGGEYLVCSELLFRGFNASIMTVDVGLDIVATKSKAMYGIQVKTSNVNSFNTYVFDVRKASFEKHNTGNIYYIFVLRSDMKNQYLILPSYEVEKLVVQGIVHTVSEGTRYRINIKFRNELVYLGNMNNAMNYYLNNWEVIK